jgi:hypothetical protein
LLPSDYQQKVSAQTVTTHTSLVCLTPPAAAGGAQVVQHMQAQRLAPGDLLCEQGDAMDGIWVLKVRR